MLYEILIAILLFLLTLFFFTRLRKSPESPKPQKYFDRYSQLQKVSSRKIENLSENIRNLPSSYNLLPTPLCSLTSLIYVDTLDLLQSAVQDLLEEEVIGVDIEEHRFRSFKGFVCLIQISGSRNTYVIDAIALYSSINRTEVLFENPRICKIFHAGCNDISWLQRDFGITCVNVFDTQIASRLLGRSNSGLNFLWEDFCDYSMSSKEKKQFQSFDWRTRPLPDSHLKYAGTDSHFLRYLMFCLGSKLDENQKNKMRSETNSICLKIYDAPRFQIEKVEKDFRKSSQQNPDSQSFFIFKELCKVRFDIAEEEDESLKYICKTNTLLEGCKEKSGEEREIRRYFSETEVWKKGKKRILEIFEEGLNQPFEYIKETKKDHQSRKEKKQERYQRFIKKYTIQGDIYENCQIQAPDGEILCYTDYKKAKWYLDRSLADLLSEDPLVIRLNFEPNGRGFSDVEADQSYYNKEKKNQCVVCGNKGRFLRYHVVPLLYRQAFPDVLKSHRSHDVVLLCPSCHEKANKQSDILKKQIAEEYGIPLNAYGDMHAFHSDLKHINKVCIAYRQHRKNMPPEKSGQMLQKISDFIENNPEYKKYLEENVGRNLEDWVQFLCDHENIAKVLTVHGNVNWKKEGINLHGKQIVERVDNLKDFIRRWRRHFIETLNPQFLSEAWSIDHYLNSGKVKSII